MLGWIVCNFCNKRLPGDTKQFRSPGSIAIGHGEGFIYYLHGEMIHEVRIYVLIIICFKTIMYPINRAILHPFFSEITYIGFIINRLGDKPWIPGTPYLSFFLGPGFWGLNFRPKSSSIVPIKGSIPKGRPVRSRFLNNSISGFWASKGGVRSKAPVKAGKE